MLSPFFCADFARHNSSTQRESSLLVMSHLDLGLEILDFRANDNRAATPGGGVTTDDCKLLQNGARLA